MKTHRICDDYPCGIGLIIEHIPVVPKNNMIAVMQSSSVFFKEIRCLFVHNGHDANLLSCVIGFSLLEMVQNVRPLMIISRKR